MNNEKPDSFALQHGYIILSVVCRRFITHKCHRENCLSFVCVSGFVKDVFIFQGNYLKTQDIQ